MEQVPVGSVRHDPILLHGICHSSTRSHNQISSEIFNFIYVYLFIYWSWAPIRGLVTYRCIAFAPPPSPYCYGYRVYAAQTHHNCPYSFKWNPDHLVIHFILYSHMLPFCIQVLSGKICHLKKAHQSIWTPPFQSTKTTPSPQDPAAYKLRAAPVGQSIIGGRGPAEVHKRRAKFAGSSHTLCRPFSLR